jgi:hypothetical protein
MTTQPSDDTSPQTSTSDKPSEHDENDKPAAVADSDAPGYSALGLQDGDPVEPNEPA